MRKVDRLKEKEIRTLPPGRHPDGNRLFLKITETQARSWHLRYASPVHVKNGRSQERDMGLGTYPQVRLSEARTLAAGILKRVKQEGIDPLDERKRLKAARRLSSSRTKTFKECALEYLPTRPKGKNPKADAQWGSTLEAYAYPTLGDVLVDQIDVPLVADTLRSIWGKKHETAKRLLGRIRTVMDWAAAHEYRKGDNPAVYGGRLKIMLGDVRVDVEHHAALDFRDMPEFMKELRSLEGVTARALEFTILCGVRTGATRFARRSEINVKDRIWTVPANKPHAKIHDGNDRIVPLSDRVIEIVEGTPSEADSPFLFIGKSSRKPLTEDDLRLFVRRMPFFKRRLEDNPDFACVPHGFRSTFDDWASETDHSAQTIDFVLWHQINDKTIAAYRRGTQVGKRRLLMRDWADYCAGKIPLRDTSNVIPLAGVGG